MSYRIGFTAEQLLLTTTQAANLLGISRTTVYALINQGELRPVHISRSCRISRAELERYVAGLDAERLNDPKTTASAPAPITRGRRRIGTNVEQRSLFAVDAPDPGGNSAA